MQTDENIISLIKTDGKHLYKLTTALFYLLHSSSLSPYFVLSPSLQTTVQHQWKWASSCIMSNGGVFLLDQVPLSWSTSHSEQLVSEVHPQGVICQRLVLPVHLPYTSAFACLYCRYSQQVFHTAAEKGPVLHFLTAEIGFHLFAWVPILTSLCSACSCSCLLHPQPWVTEPGTDPFSQEARWIYSSDSYWTQGS